MDEPKRARSRKRWIQPRPALHATAPALDPTAQHSGFALAVFTLPLPNSLGEGQRPKMVLQLQVAFETLQQGVPIL
jgi:hypothetical protein